MLPFCEAFISMNVSDAQREIVAGNATYFLEVGRCAGEVIGIADMLTILNGQGFSACPPAEATPGQLVSVVATTLKQHPAHLHENFAFLAVAAMANAWPCPK
jgi:hypothetical protein